MSTFNLAFPNQFGIFQNVPLHVRVEFHIQTTFSLMGYTINLAIDKPIPKAREESVRWLDSSST